MIIESAFMKLPEVLASYDDDQYLYEVGITHLFSNSLLLELNARNIDNPLNKIFFERRYDPLINKRCDIYTNFTFLNTDLKKYGYYRNNWIEVKYFGNIDKKSGSVAKSMNAGKIIHDLYRLLEGTSSYSNDNGLYCLVIFDDVPLKYLAITRMKHGKRKWVEHYLHQVFIN